MTQCVDDSTRHVVDWTNPVDADENFATTVNLDKGCGFPSVQLKSIAHDVFRVVGATLFGSAHSDPINDDVGIDREFNNDVELVALFGKNFVEGANLVKRSRITVEQKTALAIIVRQAIGNQSVRQTVGDIFSPIHETLCLDTKRRLVADVCSKDIPRRDGRDTEGFRQENRLSPLTGPGRTNEEHADH